MTELTIDKITDAQFRGLLAFDDDDYCHESNRTDAEKHFVYWQTIRSLDAAGLCEFHSWDGYRMLHRLTDKGRLWVIELQERTEADDPDDDYIEP
jgi:hypothetical protein